MTSILSCAGKCPVETHIHLLCSNNWDSMRQASPTCKEYLYALKADSTLKLHATLLQALYKLKVDKFVQFDSLESLA